MYALKGNAEILLSCVAGTVVSRGDYLTSRVTAHADTKLSLSDAHGVHVFRWVLRIHQPRLDQNCAAWSAPPTCQPQLWQQATGGNRETALPLNIHKSNLCRGINGVLQR